MKKTIISLLILSLVVLVGCRSSEETLGQATNLIIKEKEMGNDIGRCIEYCRTFNYGGMAPYFTIEECISLCS